MALPVARQNQNEAEPADPAAGKGRNVEAPSTPPSPLSSHHPTRTPYTHPLTGKFTSCGAQCLLLQTGHDSTIKDLANEMSSSGQKRSIFPATSSREGVSHLHVWGWAGSCIYFWQLCCCDINRHKTRDALFITYTEIGNVFLSSCLVFFLLVRLFLLESFFFSPSLMLT